MFGISARLGASLVLLVAFTQPGFAQEFQVYTQVFNERAAQDEQAHGPAIARSLTLFHAGKVYDFMIGLDEVCIFEPVRSRFVIVNTSREIAATVTLEELRRLIRIAGQETEEYLAEPPSRGGPTEKVAAALQFQLQPKFDENYDQADKRLTLSSPHLTYRVRCGEARIPEAVEQYLRYADWICRLNYVLHPQSLYPASRLTLNESLRQKGQMPVEVELQATIANRVHLRAEHSIGWSLDEKGRAMIHKAERALRSSATMRLSFREYQRAILASQTKP